jgi:hypothetical protein
MVKADSHLKLLTPSMSDMCNVFEHIDLPPIGMQVQPY